MLIMTFIHLKRSASSPSVLFFTNFSTCHYSMPVFNLCFSFCIFSTSKKIMDTQLVNVALLSRSLCGKIVYSMFCFLKAMMRKIVSSLRIKLLVYKEMAVQNILNTFKIKVGEIVRVMYSTSFNVLNRSKISRLQFNRFLLEYFIFVSSYKNFMDLDQFQLGKCDGVSHHWCFSTQDLG